MYQKHTSSSPFPSKLTTKEKCPASAIVPLTRRWGSIASVSLTAIAAYALMTSGGAANAQTGTTVTKAANLNYLNEPASWVGGKLPGASDIALWDSTITADYATASADADLSWHGIQITNPGAAVTIHSIGLLTLGAGGIDMSAATQNLTLSSDIHLGEAQGWNVGSGRTLAVNGTIAGAAGFTKLGGGTVQLVNANLYEGETIVNSGTLAISHGMALGATAGGTVVEGGVLSLSGGITVAGEALTIRGDNGPLQSSGNNQWTGNITARTNQGATTRITVNSGTLTLDGDIFMTSEGGTSTGIFVIGGNGNAIVNGVISGLDSTSTFYRSSTGTGTVFLNNANTFTGISQISNGFFQLGHRNALQFSSVNVNSANGLKFGPGIGTFTLGGLGGGTATVSGSTQVFSVSLTEAGGTTPITLQVGNNNANATYNGALTGSGTLEKIGTGIQTLNRASPDFSGAVNIKEGTLNISGDDRLGTGVVTIGAGATLGASASFTLSRPFTFAGAGAGLGANSGVTMTVDNLISGNFGLTKRGAGAVTLTNNSNDFTGDVHVLAGTLNISDVAQLGNSANNIILDGGTLGATVDLTLTRPVTIASAGGGFSANTGTTLTVETLVQGNAGLTKAGAGRVVLANDANNFTGNVRITGGALSYTKDSQLGNPANAIEFAGGVLAQFTEDFTSSRDLIFTATGSANLFQVAPGKTVEFTGALSGNGTLRVDDGNNNSSNIFPNRLLILSGSGSNGTGNTVISSNVVLSLRGATTLGSGNLNIQGNSVLELTDQVGDMTRPFGTGAGQIQLDTGVGAGFSARGANKIVAIGGIGTETAFTWNGTEKFLRTNANLVFGSATANATVDFRNALDLNASGSGVTRRILLVNGEAAGVKEAVFSGLITKSGTGSVTLEIAGNGEIEFTNGFNGSTGSPWTTIVKGGTLLLGANATSGAGNTVLSPASGPIQLGDTAALNSNGFNGAAALLTNGPFDVSRNVTVNAGNVSTATFGGNADANTTWSGTITLNKDAQLTSASTGANKVLVSGSITGVGKLTKIGGGIAELSRATGNTYAGGTEINEGTLLVSNTSGSATGAGPVTVGSDGTLGGSGLIEGVVTVDGTLAPGVLSVANTVNFGASARLALEITGATPGAGGYDQLKMTSAASAVSLTSGASISLSLSGFTPTGSEVFFVLTREDAGAFSTLFAGTTEGGFVNLGGGYTGQITYLANWDNLAPGNSSLTGGNDIAIYNVVPEPGTATTLLGGLASLLGLQRFRRRKVHH